MRSIECEKKTQKFKINDNQNIWCIALKRACIYMHNKRRSNNKKHQLGRYDRLFGWDMKASLILFIFSSLLFPPLFSSVSGMTHEFSMNVSINQSSSTHTHILLCAADFFHLLTVLSTSYSSKRCCFSLQHFRLIEEQQ